MSATDEWMTVTAAMLRRCSDQIGTLTERLAGLELGDKLTEAGREVDDIRSQLACLGESLKEATADARRRSTARHAADCTGDCCDNGYVEWKQALEGGF